MFIYLIAFTMITILKKTRGKIHLNKTQNQGGARGTQQSEAPNLVCPYGKYTNTNYVNCYRTYIPDFEDILKVNKSSINIRSIGF